MSRRRWRSWSAKVVVSNRGDAEGTHTVVLLVNGEEEGREQVSLAPGTLGVARFTFQRDEAGMYTLTADGLSTNLEVTSAGGVSALTIVVPVVVAGALTAMEMSTGGGVTVTWKVPMPVPPSSSVTDTVTVKVPAAA